MAFFLNPSSAAGPEPEATEAETPDSYFAKSTPLFKQESALPDTISGQHISLSAYISKHLKESAPDDDTESEPSRIATPTTLPAGLLWFPLPTAPKATGLMGQHLNQMDVDMGFGLEQYLPTPEFRMRVVRKRLSGEITQIQAQLQEYQCISNPSHEIRQRMQSLQERLLILKTHEAEAHQKWLMLKPHGAFTARLIHWTQTLSSHWQQWNQACTTRLAHLIYGKKFLAQAARKTELETLQHLLAERLQDPSPSESEISYLLTCYERVSQQLKTISDEPGTSAKTRSFFQEGWQQLVTRLVK